MDLNEDNDVIISRRRALTLPLLASAWSAAPAVAREFGRGSRLQYTGNPLRLPMGICDPQIRIFDDVAWLYATHDASPTSRTFTMKDWQIWRSDNLVNWSHEGTLLPEQTYFGKPSSRCWATDAIRRNGKYYLYYSVSAFGKNTSAIGLATNTTLDPSSADYKWVDHGKVIQSFQEC